MYDGWYTADTADKEEYYQASYSTALQDSISANPDDPFSDAYYEAMYASANEIWAASDSAFEAAGQWDNRGDGLQLVVLVMALGLAFAAWASLLKEESNMRLMFAVLAVIMLVWGLTRYLAVPTVPG